MEAIGRNSNLGHLCKRWLNSKTHHRITGATTPVPPGCPETSLETLPDRRRCHRYRGPIRVQRGYPRVGKRYGISKTRVASILTFHGVPIRRQGLNEEQVNGAARLYIAGKSLAWIGAVYGVSHTTVAAALRRKDVELRPRPGWVGALNHRRHEGMVGCIAARARQPQLVVCDAAMASVTARRLHIDMSFVWYVTWAGG